ncbi:MAG: putative quinol monooxygenase [Paracoccaceae bacterium]
MGIVRLTGQLLCATDADAALVAQHVPTHIALTHAEPGCLTFNVVQTADPLIWQVDESFVDQAAFEAHQTRTRASEWHALSAHIPRQFAITHD